MPNLLGIVFVLAVMVGAAAIAVFLFRRQKAARKLKPFQEDKLLRGPGESLRRRVEELSEEFANTILLGSALTAAVLGVPALVLKAFPNANPYLLFGSGITLFLAGAIVMIKRSVGLLDRRANLRLGYIGERLVAESLEARLASGWRLFHDIPISGEWGEANIDHVVVGGTGVAVVETKMRSKPSDKEAWENRVRFDGKVLSWPRCPNDSKTLWQVKKNAEWIGDYLQRECGFSVSVKQVIAIPGWNVEETVLGQPRVVSGKGAGDAVVQALGADNATTLSTDQRNRICLALEALCRDVDV